MSTGTARHIDTADAAKMIRQALHRSFPATTFSVRIERCSMGSSIRIRWTDGPSNRLVDALLKPYETKSFDGSDDSTHYGTAWLDKAGDLHAEKPATGAEEVYFGFYLHVDRDWSISFARKVYAQVAKYFGVKAPEIVEAGVSGKRTLWTFLDHFDGHEQICTSGPAVSWFQAVRTASEDRLRYAPPAPLELVK